MEVIDLEVEAQVRREASGGGGSCDSKGSDSVLSQLRTSDLKEWGYE